jgi:hypothetical protein
MTNEKPQARTDAEPGQELDDETLEGVAGGATAQGTASVGLSIPHRVVGGSPVESGQSLLAGLMGDSMTMLGGSTQEQDEDLTTLDGMGTTRVTTDKG